MSSQDAVYEKKGICGICSAGCWVVVKYDEQNRMVGVRPDDSSDMGILCRIGEKAPEIVYSPHRLKYPLKRKGEKGSYDFERISWNQAYETIVENLNRIKAESGPEATAIYTGVGTFELALCDVFQPKQVRVSSASSVLFPFGSPHTMGVGALCYVAYGMIAPHVTFGGMLVDMYNDIENSELIVVWGTNPATDLPPIDMKRILSAKGRGAEVVVIDPRRTETVGLTDALWLPIRPGTDGALALGLCNVLIEEELYDESFVENWTLGFDDFSSYVQHYRPEVVSRITGIDEQEIVSLARRLAAARGASQLMYTGLEYSNSGVQAIRAAFTLWALAGQLDVPGGRCFLMKDNVFPINRDGLVDSPEGVSHLGEDKFPVYVHYRDESHAIALPESVLNENPYKIRSLIIQGGSITTSWPNPDLWRRTLNGLDFLVCIDRQMTADAAYADIVLPACTYYETESYMTYGSVFKIREQMIEPVGEARSDFFIMAELARRLGYGHLYPQTPREMFDYVLKGSGFTIDEIRARGGMVSVDTSMMQYKKWEKGLLRKDGNPGFDTPSGKFEIASSILEEFGYDPLPVYTEPAEGPLSRPDLLDAFPLVFNSGGRMRTSFHTQHHGIKSLNKERPEPAVTISALDAQARGIADGDKVVISTPRGSLTMRAMVSENIAPGCIDANHACGSPVGPKAWQDTNINDLTDLDQYDPISGFPVYKCLLCDVEKASGSQDRLQMKALALGPEILRPKANRAPLREIYLDNNATTAISTEVREAMVAAMSVHGNPSSIHEAGTRARKIIDGARRKVAAALNCTSRRIIFTGCGSEANNMAIKGIVLSNGRSDRHVITSSIEHPSVLAACRWLEQRGVDVTYVPVDATGRIDPDDVKAAITPKTCLITIMAANNETGAIQPVKEIAEIAGEKGIAFHVDGIQAFGKIPVDVSEWGCGLLSMSAHKLYGPKGVGALYVGRDVALDALIHGGGHEHGLRSGTENTVGIAGFGKACEHLPSVLDRMDQVRGLRDRLEAVIATAVPDYRLNGPQNHRLPNTLNVTLPGFRGESLVVALARKGIYFSSGSACHAGSSDPSHALLAMGLSEADAHCALRFSLSVDTRAEDIDQVGALLTQTLNESRQLVHFVPCR